MASQSLKITSNLGKRIGIGLLILSGALLPACTDANLNDQSNQNTYDQTEGQVETATALPTIEDIAENYDKYLNQTVTVRGEVGGEFTPNYLVLEEGELIGQDDQLLVINPQDSSAMNFTEGQNIQVTGQVREYVAAEFERDYDLTWDLDVKQKIEAEYEGKPVIVSDSIQMVEDNP